MVWFSFNNISINSRQNCNKTWQRTRNKNSHSSNHHRRIMMAKRYDMKLAIRLYQSQDQSSHPFFLIFLGTSQNRSLYAWISIAWTRARCRKYICSCGYYVSYVTSETCLNQHLKFYSQPLSDSNRRDVVGR